MSHEELLSALAQSETAVVENRRQIVKQERVVAALRLKGHDTAAATLQLERLLNDQQNHERQRDRLRREVDSLRDV
jgi:hypothetical protein